MEGQQADEDTPQAGSDEPPLPPKATEPRSGIDFLRGSAAPVTPDPPRSTVDDSAVKDTPTATPEEFPREAAFTIPPAVASCSKDPQPTAPSPTPSTVGVFVGPPSATSTPKRARSRKWAQHTLLVGGRRLSASNTPVDPPRAASAPPEEDVFLIRVDTGSPALTKAQLREQMFLEASIMYDTRWSVQFSWLVFGKTKDGFPYVKCSVCMAYGKENTRYARQGDDGGRDMQTQVFRAHEHTDAHKAAVDWQLKIARGIREGQQVISNFINSDVEGRRAMVHCLGTYLTNAQMDHINSSPFLGLQCNESTDRTRGKHMIVYLTFMKDRRVVTEIFTLLTVEKCDAASLFEVLMNHLRSAAVDVSKLVGISTDGASVMVGKDNGLVARIREHAPHLFSCHCIVHREALAVKDAATSNPDLGMVDKVVRTVAAKLGDSPVWSQRFKYLQRVIYNTNLEVQGIHTVRWLSRGDAVRRLCKVLGACIVLLWERSHKVYKIVTCYKFQFCLFFFADILADMNDLNRCFQKRDIDVTEIAKTIEATTVDLTEQYLDTDKQFGGEGKCWLVGFLKLHGHGGGKKVRVRGVDGEGRPVNHLYTMHERKLPGHKVGSGYEECMKLCRSFARDCVDNLNERLDDLGKLGPTKLFRAGKWPKIKEQREKKCREWLLGCSKLFRHKLPGFDLKAAERELPTFCAIMEAHHELESFTQGLTNILGSADSKKSMRRRRPAKSVKLAVADRERRGKAKEGEVEARAAHQNDGEEEDEEEEEVDVEQALGDDQELVGEEEEDNPFLSDDEDAEEVFHIDRPGAEPGGAEPGGAVPGDAGSGGAGSGAAEPGGAPSGGAGSGAAGPGVSPTAASRREPLSPQELREWFARRWRRAAESGGAAGAGAGASSTVEGAGAAGPGAAGPAGPPGAGAAEGVGAEPTAVGPTAGGVGGPGTVAEGAGAVPAESGAAARPRPYFVPLLQQVLGLSPPVEGPPPAQSRSLLEPSSPLPAPSPYTGPTGGLAERREPASRPASPVRAARASGRSSRQRPPPVPGTHRMSLRPSTAALRAPLPSPPESSLPALADPESDSLRAARPTVPRLLATVVTDPSFESAAASALVAELVDFAARCRLDYAAGLVAESASVCPPSVGGECALGTDVLEDRQEELQCLAAASPHLASAAMDAEMASWKSTGTYVDAVPPPGANIVSGMWIFRVKRPPGSPPVFKARYVARGFSQRQGVDYFQTFSPTPKMTTLRVLLHIAAQRDYELHSLDFSTAFLQGSLHEEIWLRRPPGFTETFPPGTQWSLRRPVYGLRQAPREWHDTLRTTLAALGYLGLQITRDRARRTITLTQSHMVQQVLQRFGFTYSSPQATPLSTRHSLSALPSDESVEPSGPYPELVGCLMYLMTCTRPDLAYPLSILARYVAPGRHRPEHMAAAKRVLRYLCSTSGMGLVLGGRSPVVLTGHADASWADDQATQRSSQGYTFSLGSGSVSWRATRSSSVLSSSCEAEIYAGAMAAQELRWLTYLLTDLGEPPRSPPVLYVDNKAMLALCREQRLEHRTKHIALRYFLARELQQRGQLRLAYVASEANTADVFTKALAPCDHQRLCTQLGLVPVLPHLLSS
ncbi:unnamed protein product [Closterium sp. NIES-54]